jgi:hypothetical protein
LEKNLAQQRPDERIMGYKLEVHQKNFLKFIYGSSTSIEVLGQNEETEIGTSGIV